MNAYKNIMRDYAKVSPPVKKHKALTFGLIVLVMLAFALPFYFYCFKHHVEVKPKVFVPPTKTKKMTALKLKESSSQEVNDLTTFDFYNVLPQTEIVANDAKSV